MVPMIAAGDQRRLILAGGGHAHLHVLKELSRQPIPHVEVVLISPSPFQYYSGLISGYIEGTNILDEIRVDLRKLAETAGVRLVQDRVISVDAKSRVIHLASQESLSYDALSFDIGSQSAGTDTSGVLSYGLPVKPLEAFMKWAVQEHGDEAAVVVGGGAAGLELSLALQARNRTKGGSVSLISAGSLLGMKTGSRIHRRLTQIVAKQNVRLYENDAALKVDQGIVILTSGRKVPFQHLIWAAGPKAPDVFMSSGLQVRDGGYLLVTPKLQSVDYPEIFAAGDCAALDGHRPLPKAGVYAVREAPYLWSNLCAFFSGTELQAYSPQRDYLSLMSTGNRKAILLYKKVLLYGRWCWKLKRWIDERFVRQYQRLYKR
ncbi:FAD-dependent oxidoreductase [Paenibacillus sp. F411]|uniref:FAD-dependent oxidoreductase n=1 Tax=Paenibacillus sp. F411 TaxID=2820239 RepID=UPI001AAEF462|nr:FAD-dependent oxidoreductase [Paenibacillus sp. F411]MBO2942835.1 FAD-dependent oxidoreductase [Paenibacillus sp. F411]